MEDTSFVSDSPDGVDLEVIVQPRASKSAFVGLHEGRLKVRIAAPPVDGEANDELVRFVARFFSLSKSSITIAQGQRGRRKRLHLKGTSKASVLKELSQLDCLG